MMASCSISTEQRIIAEVMEENNVSPDDIPVENPFDPSRPASQIDGSKRYFHVKGFARFNEHDDDDHVEEDEEDESDGDDEPRYSYRVLGARCTRTWPSAHAWCIMDLKEQKIVKRYPQDCQRCDGSAQPEFDEEAIRRMAEYAVKSFLIRSGLYVSPRDPFDFRDLRDSLDHEGQQPHDEARCARCRELGRRCCN